MELLRPPSGNKNRASSRGLVRLIAIASTQGEEPNRKYIVRVSTSLASDRNRGDGTRKWLPVQCFTSVNRGRTLGRRSFICNVFLLKIWDTGWGFLILRANHCNVLCNLYSYSEISWAMLRDGQRQASNFLAPWEPLKQGWGGGEEEYLSLCLEKKRCGLKWIRQRLVCKETIRDTSSNGFLDNKRQYDLRFNSTCKSYLNNGAEEEIKATGYPKKGRGLFFPQVMNTRSLSRMTSSYRKVGSRPGNQSVVHSTNRMRFLMCGNH